MVNALLGWHSCEFLKQILGFFFYCIDTVNGGASNSPGWNPAGLNSLLLIGLVKIITLFLHIVLG